MRFRSEPFLGEGRLAANTCPLSVPSRSKIFTTARWAAWICGSRNWAVVKLVCMMRPALPEVAATQTDFSPDGLRRVFNSEQRRAQPLGPVTGRARLWQRMGSPTAPTQARCHSEADLREAAKLSTNRRQNSDHGGPCSIRSRRRSASRRHLSRPSVSCFTDAEKNASRARASSLIERDCSTSMRRRFISMSSSFSSRRMTGNGSGASQGWGPRNGLMMTTFAAALIWRVKVSKRGLQLVKIRADARNFQALRAAV